MNNKFNESDLDFLEISNHLYDGIFITDGEARTVFVNNAYEKMTGIKKEDLIGSTVMNLSHNNKYFEGAVSPRVIKEKKVISSIGKSLINGRDMLITGSPVFDTDGNVKLVVVNNRDITDIRKLEAKILKYENYKDFMENDTSKLLKVLEKSYYTETNNPKVNKIIQVIKQIAPTNIHILISGETGSGKGSLADEIFINSNQMSNLYRKINCLELHIDTLNDIMFGYEDENDTHVSGYVDLLTNGTIFIDEIWATTLEFQSKLLEYLTDNDYNTNEEGRPKIRFIFSSSHDLKDEIAKHTFLEDLYHEISTVELSVVPLRERKEDINMICEGILNRCNQSYNKELKFTPQSLEALNNYEWPGNIRELIGVIERFSASCDKDEFNESIIETLNIQKYKNPLISEMNGKSLPDIISEYEKEIIKIFLKKYSTVSKAATHLGVSQPTLWNKCLKYDIDTKIYK